MTTSKVESTISLGFFSTAYVEHKAKLFRITLVTYIYQSESLLRADLLQICLDLLCGTEIGTVAVLESNWCI